MLVRKKPIPIEAVQWDYTKPHHKVTLLDIATHAEHKCKTCGNVLLVHGEIETLEGPHFVCPGDWILGPGFKDEFWPVKPDIFAGTYEEVK